LRDAGAAEADKVFEYHLTVFEEVESRVPAGYPLDADGPFGGPEAKDRPEDPEDAWEGYPDWSICQAPCMTCPVSDDDCPCPF